MTPGIKPLWAIFRKVSRDSPNLRRFPRARPVRLHLRLTRRREPAFGSLCSFTEAAKRSSGDRCMFLACRRSSLLTGSNFSASFFLLSFFSIALFFAIFLSLGSPLAEKPPCERLACPPPPTLFKKQALSNVFWPAPLIVRQPAEAPCCPKAQKAPLPHPLSGSPLRPLCLIFCLPSACFMALSAALFIGGESGRPARQAKDYCLDSSAGVTGA